MSWAERLDRIISEKGGQTVGAKVAKARLATLATADCATSEKVNDPLAPLATYDYGASHIDLQQLAGDDWQILQHDPALLRSFTHAAETRRMRESGHRPKHYTQLASCKYCGVVWLWKGAPPHVEGCPWCFNRVAGKPIPRPCRDGNIQSPQPTSENVK